MIFSSRYISSIAMAGVLMLGSATASAAGFAIMEQSVKGLGAAFSNTAEAGDASAMFFNVATLGNLEGTEFMAAAHVIAPSSEFTDSGSFVAPALTADVAVPGTLSATATATAGDAGVTSAVPNLYLHHQFDGVLEGRLHAGLGINAPFALKTAYNDNWVGRYHALTSSVRTTNINPALAFEVSPALTVGVGLNAQLIEARLTNALDQSSACLPLAAAGAFGPLGPGGPAVNCAAVGLGTPATVATDANLDIHGMRDWSLGYNAGFLWQPVESTRLGVHYRSSIEHKVKGRARFTKVNPALAAATAAAPGVTSFTSQSASATVTLPESASVHVYHAFTDHWAAHADVAWTAWSQFDRLEVNFADGTTLVQPENWNNSMRYSGGVTYTRDSTWSFRAGAAFDETPVPNATLRTPRIPDADRIWVTAGVSYNHNNQLTLDAGYAYLMIDDPDISNTEILTDHTLVGSYDADVHIVGLQAAYRF